MKSYEVSKAIAWQTYEDLDLLIILNRCNKEFYFFQETGKIIISQLLKGIQIEEIIKNCIDEFDTNQDEISKSVDDFCSLLEQEGIINEWID